MVYKYNIIFLKLLIILTIISNLKCRNDINISKPKFLNENLTILKLSKGYKITLHKDRFEFNSTKKSSLSSGEYFAFQTNKKIFYKNIKIINSLNKRKHKLIFKLYINNVFWGIYQTNESIKINKKVISIKIIYLKTENENIYNAWDISSTYKFIKRNKKSTIKRPKLEIIFVNKNKFNSLNFFSSKKNRFAKIKPNIKYKLFPKNITTSIITNKKSELVTESSFIFNSDGSFQVHQLEASKKSKKINKDFFYEGNWNVKKIKNETVLELSGYISGYFSENKNKYIESELFNCKPIIKNNILISNGTLSSFNLDIPESSLVNIKEFTPNIVVEMPYSTANNFTGVKLYPCNKCYLRYKVVKDIIKVNKAANKLNYKLKFFDCYRPFYVQAIMFKKFPVKGYVADSIGGSVHNRGSAIDVTIVDNNSNELDMGTEFDNLSYKSNHNYKYFSDTILNNRLMLKNIMIENNFVPINSEWWHYNHKNARDFRKLNLNFPCK